MPEQKSDLLLIYPPIAKATEAPAGIAQIKRAMQAQGLSCHTIDANIEAQHFLINSIKSADSRPLAASLRNREKNLAVLKNITAYKKFDHYKRAVLELNRLLKAAGQFHAADISFTDFKQQGYSPVRSEDLLRAAKEAENSPFFQYYDQVLLKRIARHDPAVIGISLVYLSQAVATFALIGLLRRHWPQCKIVLGGGLITSWMSQPTWRSPFAELVDSCIPGRGEQPILKLFGKKDSKRFYQPYIGQTKDNYFSPGEILAYTTSYGCYWQKCTFCPETAECSTYSPIPYDQVFSDLDQLIAPQTRLIHFLDNALSPALLKKMTKQKLPAPWYGYVRFTSDLEDIGFCRALKESGCVLLQLGLESGDQGVLDAMRKGIELKGVSRVLQNLKQVGIHTFIYLLFGTPWEMERQARNTIAFVLDHSDCIQYLNPAIFNMPVYSQESQNHQTKIFYKGDLTLYHNFDHPGGWNRRIVRRFLHSEFLSHPKIKKIINANPPAFTSNHAPFFTDHFLRQ